jgi:hypothetical protein
LGQFLWAAALVAAASASPPHWDSHPSTGADRSGRTLRIADTTGDAGVRRALRDFKKRWNAMVARRQLRLGGLPRVEVVALDPSPGCPGQDGARAPGGDVVVCRDDSLATAGVGGPYWVDESGHTRFGIVKLRRATLEWSACNLRTAVAHEMGHVMGLPHNDEPGAADQPSVMMSGNGPYHRGCPTWFNAGDLQSLQSLYQHAD